MKKIVRFSVLVIAAAALVFAACDSSDGGDDNSGAPTTDVYVGLSGGKQTVLRITGKSGAASVSAKKVSRAAGSPVTNGDYELEIDSELVSKGRVSSSDGATLTFVSDEDNTFEVDISGGIPEFTETVQLDGDRPSVAVAILGEVAEGFEPSKLFPLDGGDGSYTFDSSFDVLKNGELYTPAETVTFQSYYDEYDEDSGNSRVMPFISAEVSTSGKLSLTLKALTSEDEASIAQNVDKVYDIVGEVEEGGLSFTPDGVIIKTLGDEDFHQTGPRSEDNFWQYALVRKKEGDLHGENGGYVEYWYANKDATASGKVTVLVGNEDEPDEEKEPYTMEVNVLLKKGWNSVLVESTSASSSKIYSGEPGNDFKWEAYQIWGND